MINFAIAAVGHLPGGLAIASVLACMLFAAVSGSSPATVVAIGSIVIAGMVKVGYTQAFATGVIVNAGTLGILIPPSIVMVVYGAATETSVGRLFMAGVVPGILLGVALMVAIYVAARVMKLPRQPKASWRERLRAVPRRAVGPAADRHRDGRHLWRRLHADRSGRGRRGLCLRRRGVHLRRPEAGRCAARAHRFRAGDGDADVHHRQRLPVRACADHRADPAGHRPADRPRRNLQPWQFLLIVNIILLVAGNFMEPSAIVLITAPILFPTAMKLGIDPIHLGIVYRGQHGDRHGDAAGRAQPVRRLGYHRHAAADAWCAPRCPG